MKIAVNTRWLIKDKLEGIGWFTYHLFSRMVKNHPEDEFYFYFDRSFDKSFIFGDNVHPFVLQPPARHKHLWYIWNEYSVPYFLKKHKPDVYFSPDGFIPSKSKTKIVNTIHDLNFEHYSGLVPKWAETYYKKHYPIGAKNCDKLVTVSEYSKKDIMNAYHISEGKIEVVSNACDGFKIIGKERTDKFKNENTEGSEYFVFVGSLNPRKNLTRIFKAFDQLSSDIKLVIVGEKMSWDKEIESAFMQMKNKNKVIFTGRLEGEKLNTVLSGAISLVFPSLFEGFGIPILEAYQSGIPVITANNSSMPEVAGGGAILVDALDEDQIRDAMLKMANSESIRRELIEKSKEQLKKYNWDESSDKLYKILKETTL